MEFTRQVEMSESVLPQSVIDVLESGFTIVTSNQRAARTLRLAFDRRNRAQGLQSWQPATVLAWEAWTAELWRRLVLEGHATKLLLNHTQEHIVWRNLIARDIATVKTIRSADSLAELAADAWRLLNQYNVAAQLRGEESKIFQPWIIRFERQCQDHGWLPPALLEDTLHIHATAGHLHLTPGIALLGFDEITPARRVLLDAIQAAGAEVRDLNLSIAAEDRRLVSAEDLQEEITAAARWAREHLRRNPDARIGIIEPALESRRSGIQRTLREILAPELEDITATHNSAPYEFSIGSRLDETPLVRAALDLLRWAVAPLHIDRVSALLISPLFAMTGEENDARAAFDAYELRRAKLLRPEISISRLRHAIRRSRHRREHLYGLRGALAMLERTAARHRLSTAARSYAEWAGVMRDLLDAARWGRAGEEDSIEFQTRKRWESALDDLASLDFDGSRVSYVQALVALERIARLTMFAPESRDAPVQVLGPVEAAGSTFDGVWFLGAGDLTWPARGILNPLLPRPLAVRLGIPGASLITDNLRASRTVSRIAASAREIVFSYATVTDNGRQRPAALLNALHLRPTEASALTPMDATTEPVVLDKFSDTTPLPLLPDIVFHGGARILEAQAACPFRSFAEYRLRSVELESIELGMDDAERGSMLHKVLESFWNEVKTQAVLKSMTGEEREIALSRAIEYGLHKTAEPSSEQWDTAYIEVQRDRLHRLLQPWLEIEMNRDEFTVIQTEKRDDSVRIGPLLLGVRMDRVDSSDRGLTIIDYKTGKARTRDWDGDRPDAPQLPLYAVVASQAAQVAEIAFGRIRPGEMVLDGISERVTDNKKTYKRPAKAMNEQIEEWRGVLDQLATDFHRGEASVDPKDYPNTCRYCAQRTLCRLDPAAFEEYLDDEETNDIWNG